MVSAVSELDQLTRAAELVDSTAAGARAAVEELPWLGAAIADDRRAGRFADWGRSTIIDENTGTPVIPRALFDELHRRAGVTGDWPIGNAGLLHCYGYLLSMAATPYGLKRERWIGSALAEACGLTANAFHPWRRGPSLLARATTAASALFAGPAVGATQSVDGREALLALSAASGPAALAYAVAPTPSATPLLVTMFPVAEATVPATEFRSTPRLRWNAV